MKPIHVESANAIIRDIPVNRTMGMVLSQWKLSWSERLEVLIHGKVWLMQRADTMPRTLLSGNQAFRVDTNEATQ